MSMSFSDKITGKVNIGKNIADNQQFMNVGSKYSSAYEFRLLSIIVITAFFNSHAFILIWFLFLDTDNAAGSSVRKYVIYSIIWI